MQTHPMALLPRRRPRRLAHVLVLIALIGTAGTQLSACAQPTPSSDRGDAASPAAGSTAASGVGAESTPASAVTAPAAPAAGVAEATARVAAMLPAFTSAFGAPGTNPGELQLVNDVAVDSAGNMYVSDSKGVTKFDPSTKFLAVVGNGELKAAAGIAVGPDDTLYVSGNGSLLWKYAADGRSQGTLGTEGTGPGQLSQPVDVAVDSHGNVYVVDARNAHVEKFSAAGQHLLTIGERGDKKGQFTVPRAVAVDSAGRVLVGLGDDFLVQRFAADGSYIDSFGQGHANEYMWRIGGIAVDTSDNYYLTVTTGHKLQSFSGGDKPKFKWEMGQLGFGAGSFNSPLGLEVKANTLYVADQQNNQVQRFALK